MQLQSQLVLQLASLVEATLSDFGLLSSMDPQKKPQARKNQDSTKHHQMRGRVPKEGGLLML